MDNNIARACARRWREKLGLFATAALLSLMCGEAVAQEASLDELVVTARKRVERLQDIPAAGSAISAEKVDLIGGMANPRDLVSMLPGVSLVDNDGTNSEFAIRGAGQAGRSINADSAIALLRNGAQVTGGNIGGRGFARVDYFDLDRIEVLRGPQGSLYGANAVGGVISIVSQAPKDRFEWLAQGGYDFNKSGIEGVGIVNVPLANGFAFRAGVDFTDDSKGQVYNSYRHDYADSTIYRGGRASLGWTAGPRLKVVASVDMSRLDEGTGAQVDVERRRYAALPETFDYQSQVEGNTKARTHQNLANGGLNIDADLGFADLAVVSNYRWRDSSTVADDDGRYPGAPALSNGAPNIAGGATCRTNNCSSVYADQVNVFYQEARLSGKPSTLTWQAGVDYRDLRDDYSITTLGRVSGSTPVAPTFQILLSDNYTLGSFGALSYKITPDLTAEGSARWTQDHKEFHGGLSSGTPQIGSIPLRTKTYVNWTYGGSLSWRPTSDLNLYGRLATGYRAGGFNRDFGNSNTLPGNPVTPIAYGEEKTRAFEAGVKYRLSRELRATLAVFSNRYRNVLITDQGTRSVAQGGGTFNYLGNLGNATSSGIDGELSGALSNILGSGGGLTYSAALTWVKSNLESTITTLDGHALNGTPKYALNLNATYTHPLSQKLEAFVSANFQGEDGGFYDIANSIGRDKNRNLQLRTGLRSRDGWEVALRASNVFNQRYVFLNGAGFLAATPRGDYLLQVRYRH